MKMSSISALNWANRNRGVNSIPNLAIVSLNLKSYLKMRLSENY